MGSTCSIHKTKRQKQQSLDQLSFECDEFGVLHPEEPENKECSDEPAKARSTVVKDPPKPFDPDEDDVSDTCGWVSAKQFHNYFYEGFYAPFILNPDYMLIVDTRPHSVFLQGHIATSQWHGDVTLNDSQLDLTKYSLIILYDQDGAADENSTVRRIQMAIASRDRNLEPMIIRGGMDVIGKQFPYLLAGFNHQQRSSCGNNKRPTISWFPAIIVDDALYLGRTEHALNAKVIRALSITHVVNLSSRAPHIFPSVSYLCIPVPEAEEVDLRPSFSQINTQISKALAAGGHVLVHCDDGVDPSATIVIGFLMADRQCTLADAHDYVKSLRPIIQPSDEFFQQLSDYEVELFGKKHTCLEDLWI